MNDKVVKINNNSKVKARNFLTNVSYSRIAAVDFNNINFVIDCYTFLTVYMNPFYLERKFESIIEREFVNVLWSFLLPDNLYHYVCLDENMKILNKVKVRYRDGKTIIIEFLKQDQDNVNILSDVLRKNGVLFQYLFGNLFPKCFSRINDYGISAKTSFNRYYHSYILQKNTLKFKEEEQQQQQQEQEQNEREFNSPLNMTSLFDVQNDDDNDDFKENFDPKLKTEQVKKQKTKRKIKTSEEKKQIREAKKRKLLEELNENTEKLLKIKRKN